MRKSCAFSVAAVLGCVSAASASMTLQMDLNALGLQVRDAGGAPVAFGGLSHTGSVELSQGAFGYMAGIYVDGVNQNFVGSLTAMSGTIELLNGNVTGGSLTVTVNGADTYTADISNVGNVSSYVGGGYILQGLTVNGAFSSAMYGNVNVAPWNTGGLMGSFLKFNFNPDAGGSGYADIDLFVNVIPLPPGVYMGAALIGGMVLIRRVRAGRASV
jgi:hypothetical protein